MKRFIFCCRLNLKWQSEFAPKKEEKEEKKEPLLKNFRLHHHHHSYTALQLEHSKTVQQCTAQFELSTFFSQKKSEKSKNTLRKNKKFVACLFFIKKLDVCFLAGSSSSSFRFVDFTYYDYDCALKTAAFAWVLLLFNNYDQANRLDMHTHTHFLVVVVQGGSDSANKNVPASQPARTDSISISRWLIDRLTLLLLLLCCRLL